MNDVLIDQEREKYQDVWSYDFYRRQADGDPIVNDAYSRMRCQPGDTLIDWGCGRGTPAQAFAKLGLKVTGVDIAANCLNKGVDIPLVVGCLWDHNLPENLGSDYAFCTDVLEHIPPERLDDTLFNIAMRTRVAAYIQVCTVKDSAGKQMNPPHVLHLTVMPAYAWELRLRPYWRTVRSIESGKKARHCFLCAK